MRRSTIAAVLVALVALAGCGEDDAGKVIDGTGYEVTVPEGWKDESEAGEKVEVAGFTPDLVLAGDREDGFTTNVNVLRTPEGGLDLDAQTRAERELLERGGKTGEIELPAARGMTPVERTTLGGKPARAYELELTQGERTVRLRQFIAQHGGSNYSITLTAMVDRFDEGKDAFESIIDSWRWK